jgi:rRNA biogenesis protein RRP5
VQLEIGKQEWETVRECFERMTKVGMKKRRANFVFKRWLEFEEQHGTKQQVDKVKVKAREWVEKMARKGGDADEE